MTHRLSQNGNLQQKQRLLLGLQCHKRRAANILLSADKYNIDKSRCATISGYSALCICCFALYNGKYIIASYRDIRRRPIYGDYTKNIITKSYWVFVIIISDSTCVVSSPLCHPYSGETPEEVDLYRRFRLRLHSY